jgi:hypothetical protein
MRGFAAAFLLMLTGCDDFLAVCHSCLTSDPAKPVVAAEIAKIGLVYSGKRLPASASNIYYHELCGIDCQQWIRFDAPLSDALAFADGLLVRPLTRQTTPGIAEAASLGPESAKMPWWPTSFPAGVEFGENTINDGGNKNGKGQPLTIFVQRHGATATLWLAAFTT